MICTCSNTLEFSPDGRHYLSCAHTAAPLDDDDDEEALLLDLDELDASIEMEIDEMYLPFDF